MEDNLEKEILGFIVNPIAGMGGKVGLKGSDGQKILNKARELGARPESSRRAIETLKKITCVKDNIELITYPYEMGEDETRECGFNPVVIGSIKRGNTTSQDTENAAREMLRLKVDLILFVGETELREIFIMLLVIKCQFWVYQQELRYIQWTAPLQLDTFRRKIRLVI